MNDDDLKKILSEYRVPEAGPHLEAKVLARVAREGAAEELPEPAPELSWRTMAFAGALSVALAVAVGCALGVREARLMLFAGDPILWGG